MPEPFRAAPLSARRHLVTQWWGFLDESGLLYIISKKYNRSSEVVPQEDSKPFHSFHPLFLNSQQIRHIWRTGGTSTVSHSVETQLNIS